MQNFMWVLLSLDGFLLLIISNVDLDSYEMSEAAAREQLSHKSGGSIKQRRALHKLLPAMRQLKNVLLVILALLFVAILIHQTKPLSAVIWCLAGFFALSVISNFKILASPANFMFEKSLGWLLPLLRFLKPVWWLVGLPPRKNEQLPASKFEFLYQLQRLPSTVLEPNERQRLEDSLQASEKTVEEIMTPKKQVISVAAHATIGPIVLDDLTKTEHGLFPVLDKTDEVIGILDLAQVGDLENAKQRQTVKELMSSQVHSIENSASLLEAAQAFLSAKQYLLIVRKNEAFHGVITIADLLRSLTGIVKDE